MSLRSVVLSVKAFISINKYVTSVTNDAWPDCVRCFYVT